MFLKIRQKILVTKSSKVDGMHLQKLKQLQHECNTLKRLLLFLKEENIVLKNRLSEILKESFDKNLLEEAEDFNNAFIKEDERMSLLRNDMVELDKLLEKEFFKDRGKISVETAIKLNNLRNNISKAENQFATIQLKFNKFFSEKI